MNFKDFFLILKMKFEDLKVSTKTVIALTNTEINIINLFNELPITSYVVKIKKRGRKKLQYCEDPNKDIPEGSIIYMKHRDQIRGVMLKPPKKQLSKKKFFRNALTIVMILKHNGTNKKINFKITKNGKYQITGCKFLKHAKEIIKFMWKYKKDIPNSFMLPKNTNFKILFNTVMTNVDFNLGFLVDRENLDRYINSNTSYNSLLETSFGYTGVNIKIPLEHSPSSLPSLEYIKDKWVEGMEEHQLKEKKTIQYISSFS